MDEVIGWFIPSFTNMDCCFSCSVMSDSFVTRWTAAHQAPQSMECPRKEYWSGLLFPSPGHFPYPEIEPASPALAGGFFTTEPPGKSWYSSYCCLVAKSCPLFDTPWTIARQASPVFLYLPEFAQTHVHWVGDTIQPSHPLLPLLLLPSVFPSIRVFSKESTVCIRWPKYWNFSFSISLSREYSGLISFKID